MLLRLRPSCKRRAPLIRPPRQPPPSLASPHRQSPLTSLSCLTELSQLHLPTDLLRPVPSPQPRLQNDRSPSLTDSPSPSPPSLPHRQSFSLTSLSASPNSQLNKTLGSVKEKESERNKDGFSVGQEGRLIFGKKKNLGLKGTIVKRMGSDSIVLRVEKSGDPVLVFYGKHKGAYGNLVQRDLDREVGVVQDYGSHELLNVKLEQIVEYVGDPSYIGY